MHAGIVLRMDFGHDGQWQLAMLKYFSAIKDFIGMYGLASECAINPYYRRFPNLKHGFVKI